MFQLTAIYHHPEDVAAFDKYYDDVHAPLASTIPGLQRYTYSHPGPDPEGNPPAYYSIAVLEFADEASFGAAMSSPEGEATVGDLANFAGAGVTILAGPSRII